MGIEPSEPLRNAYQASVTSNARLELSAGIAPMVARIKGLPGGDKETMGWAVFATGLRISSVREQLVRGSRAKSPTEFAKGVNTGALMAMTMGFDLVAASAQDESAPRPSGLPPQLAERLQALSRGAEQTLVDGILLPSTGLDFLDLIRSRGRYADAAEGMVPWLRTELDGLDLEQAAAGLLSCGGELAEAGRAAGKQDAERLKHRRQRKERDAELSGDLGVLMIGSVLVLVGIECHAAH
jgi:hypothetical protein